MHHMHKSPFIIRGHVIQDTCVDVDGMEAKFSVGDKFKSFDELQAKVYISLRGTRVRKTLDTRFTNSYSSQKARDEVSLQSDQVLRNYIRLYTWRQKVQTSRQRKACDFVGFINDLFHRVDGKLVTIL